MPRLILFGGGTLLLLLAVLGWRMGQPSPSETVFEDKTRPPEAAPLCPWREPASDLKRLFPNATRYTLDTRILSGQRLELAERLGRAPTGDENALHLYRIYRDRGFLGTVVTRRVKGVYGAIELVLAADSDGRVCGLLVQRLREPESVARALKNPDWLRSFEGKRADSSWNLGHDVPDVPVEARASAEAVVEGARSALILLAVADPASSPSPAAPPHH